MNEIDLLVGAIVQRAILDYVKTDSIIEMCEIGDYFRNDGAAQMWFEQHGVDAEKLLEKLNEMRKNSK